MCVCVAGCGQSCGWAGRCGLHALELNCCGWLFGELCICSVVKKGDQGRSVVLYRDD